MSDEHRSMIAQSPMDTSLATPLLGGLSPRVFMRRHWQKKPLLVRQALPGGVRLIERTRLFEMVAAEEVESRLVVRKAGRWSLRQGPMKRAALPPLRQREWTLLVQGLDLHLPAARALLERFRFVPDVRLDDLMISYASDGGGVGPHVDSYDVFLLQAEGRRRWHIGPVRAPELVAGVPLKILANFEPEQSFLLEPGDMLYLPPGWAHDGVAEGECTTCSIGFRAPSAGEIGRDVLQRLLDAAADGAAEEPSALYRDASQPATQAPAQIPAALQSFAATAVARLLRDPHALACALGEVLSEPKRGVWFDANEAAVAAEFGPGICLDQRTRMIYDEHHVFINGESFRAAGRDARLVRQLADERRLGPAELGKLSEGARGLIDEWLSAGWLRFGDANST
jgi:50S ribosomal protein L16 3-hydroxylase